MKIQARLFRMRGELPRVLTPPLPLKADVDVEVLASVEEHKNGEKKSATTIDTVDFCYSSTSIEYEIETLSDTSSKGDNCIDETPDRSTKKPSGVRFAQVEVYYHPIILGDNPSVSGGPPLSIGWLAEDKTTVSVNAFEGNKADTRPRTKQQLKIPRGRREYMLRQRGYSYSDFARVEAFSLASFGPDNSEGRTHSYPAPKVLTFFKKRHAPRRQKRNQGN